MPEMTNLYTRYLGSMPVCRCVFFSPNSVDTLGVLTIIEKQLCLDRCAARPANSLLLTVHSRLSKSSKCISTAQAHKICLPAAGASNNCALVVVPWAFSHMVISFCGRRKGNLMFWPHALVLQSRLFVTGGRDPSCLHRNAVFVAGAALWTWW